MKYTQFIEGYKISKDKETYAKKHIVKKYIPYTEKLSNALNVALTSVHSDADNPNIYKRNTPHQYFFTIVKILQMYTDIEWADKDVIDLYDSLNEANAMNTILSSIPENEIVEFRTLIDMCISDIYENERDLVSFLETKIDAFNMVLATLAESLKETLSNIDINTINNSINEFTSSNTDNNNI